MKFSIKIMLICLTLSPSGRAGELLVPTPDLPSVFDPATGIDVFSINAIRQIHRSLFRLDEGGRPQQDLVEKFSLSQNKRTLDLYLLPLNFHNGIQLESKHVRASLERAIQLRTNGFQKFACLKGFTSFMKGSSKISGIALVDKKHLRFHFTCESPRLFYA